jgi:hypothetical protein
MISSWMCAAPVGQKEQKDLCLPSHHHGFVRHGNLRFTFSGRDCPLTRPAAMVSPGAAFAL